MTLSPKKYVSTFTSSTANRGVGAKETDIAAKEDMDATSTHGQESDVEIRSQASGDTGSYLQVVVQKHKRKPNVATTQTSPRLPTASSPIKAMRQGEHLYVLQHPMLLPYPNTIEQEREKNTQQAKISFWDKFKSTNESPDKIDLYYFEKNTGDFLATSDGTFTHTENLAAKISKVPSKIVAEIFAVPQIVLGVPVAVFLNVERSLFVIIRSFVVGSVQIWSDYLFKPVITLSFNAVIQPPLVLLGNVGRAVRAAVRPFAEMLGDILEPLVKVLSAIRFVNVEKCRCSHNV